MKHAHASRQAVRRPMDEARLTMGRLSPTKLGLEKIFRRICRIAAETLRVERAGIWLFMHDGSELRCAMLFELSREEFSEGTTLQVADFPAYFESLRVRKTIPAEFAAQDPRTGELLESYLAPLHIEAMLDAPILLDGEVIGVVCHEHVGQPREWTTEERDFAGSVADTLAMKIKGAEIVDAQRVRQLDADRRAAFRQRDGLAHLAAGVAHDFRNLLTVVTGSAQELRLVGGDRREIVELADLTLDAARRGASLAGQLMELARDQAGHPKVLDAVQVAEDVLSLLQQAVGERHQVELTGAVAAGRVFMDREQLERVLMNLVVNARDAMADGGIIHVRVNGRDHGPPDATATRDVVIEVQDSGPGIEPSILPQIFDPFFSTKARHQGAGLGLAIVRHIVELAGGTIEVDSRPGEGTTFLVRLPRVAG